MSANPTRVDWESATAEGGSSLQQGNRVLDSIARQEAMRALLAFSELREQIRNRRTSNGNGSDRDLFETERFILDEVLQLICNRSQGITQADGIVIALAEPYSIEGQTIVCRASAGSFGIEPGTPLIGESEFLRDCLESGNILRCDDCEIDTRVEMDFARKIEARSTVLVPLRGRDEQIGVLQAFSKTPWAFTDHDIRCFDLFAELVLGALKPEDQDRRISWLSDVASQVLTPRTTAMEPVEVQLPPAPPTSGLNTPENTGLPVELGPAPPVIVATTVEPPTTPEIAEAVETVSIPALVVDSLVESPFVDSPSNDAPFVEVPETAVVVPEFVVAAFVAPQSPESEFDAVHPEFVFTADTAGSAQPAMSVQPRRLLLFPHRGSIPRTSRTRNWRLGLGVVAGLLAVAALFSVGAWWGMQMRGQIFRAAGSSTNAPIARQSITTPGVPAPNLLMPPVSDDLMNPANAGSEAAPLTAVAESKLATLPKITGVRHWSSSMGSTVVIDMEDQVPYEVHRLMSPERIYFDLHDTVLSPELDGKTMDVGDASLTRVRVAQPVAGITRIVLDTKDGSNFSVGMESSPYRLVVELRGTDKSSAASGFVPNRVTPSQNSSNQTSPLASATIAATPRTTPAAVLASKPSEPLLPARSGKFRIVLDAGHGGWDLGTVGRQGLLEKDLVLDVTQRLGKLLQARLGSDVLFTRTSDNYLALDQRADFANQSQADLFVSVHANYSSSATARGVETYYTNLFSAPGSKEVEKHDDGTFAKLTPVSLSAAGLHQKIAESQRLASNVQQSLYATLAASSPDIRNRGTKASAFVVLTGTTMPAILTEISFVSSPADEHNLQSAAYRQQIAEALFKGIARYQESAPRSKASQVTTASARR